MRVPNTASQLTTVVTTMIPTAMSAACGERRHFPGSANDVGMSTGLSIAQKTNLHDIEGHPLQGRRHASDSV
jgi:hypothetical protein